MDDIFKGCYYSGYEVFDLKNMTDNDIMYGTHLLLEIGRGGIDVYKVMTLSQIYKSRGYFWIREKTNNRNHIIVRERA